MIDNKRRVKEIYDCAAVISDDELSPLQKWYNQLIDKTFAEITVADVLRMMRQKQFMNLAMLKSIEFLKNNIFAGELYDGEILEKVSEQESPFLMPYADDLEKLIKDAVEKSAIHKWSYDGEEYEFNEIVNVIKKSWKIKVKRFYYRLGR